MTSAIDSGAAASVGVIIPAWNRLGDTLECICSLCETQDAVLHIVVVDNGSDPPLAAPIHARYPNVHVVRSEQNLGFAGGVNLGIGHVQSIGTEFVLILNNDTHVAPEALPRLVDTARTMLDFQIFSPVITYMDPIDRVWFAGGTLDRARAAVRHEYMGCAVSEVPARVYGVDWANGCALFARAETLVHVGPFDERLFALWEEVDWCLRAARLGLRCGVEPRARIAHKVSATFGSQESYRYVYLYYRNRLQVIGRHLGWRPAMAAFLDQSWLAAVYAKQFLYGASAARVKALAVLQANVDGVLGRSGVPTFWLRDGA